MNKSDKNYFRHGRLMSRFLPILVWLSVVAYVLVLFQHRAQRFESVGLVHTQTIEISSATTGFLKAVPVRLFQNVDRHDIVAVLDDKLLHAQLKTVKAEIERLQAELKITRDQLMVEKQLQRSDLVISQRRYFIDVENARLRILELIAAIEPERIMLDNLQIEIDIEKKTSRRRSRFQ